jgi:hypothetical protein
MVLRGNYGEKIHKTFRMTRQGVRWRFWHLFNQDYVQAFEAILAIEKVFGPQLREHAIRISKERYALRQEAMQTGFQSADVFMRTEAKPEQGHDQRAASEAPASGDPR